MVNMRNDSDYKILIDDINPDEILKTDELLKNEIKEIRKEQRSQRNTFLIFIILLVIGMVVFVYFDIKQRVQNISTEGASEVKSLSSDVESRFSSLSIQYAKFEENFINKVKEIDGNYSSLKNAVDRLSSEVGSVKKSVDVIAKQKADKVDVIAGQEDLAATIKDLKKSIDEKLAPVKTDMENMGSAIESLSKSMESFKSELLNVTIYSKIDEKYKKDFVDLKKTIDSVTSNLILLESEISKISQETDKMPDKAYIEKTLQYNDKALLDIRRDVDERIMLLTDRLKALENELGKTKGATQTKDNSGQKQAAPNSGADQPDKTFSPAKPVINPATGKIIEQDIN